MTTLPFIENIYGHLKRFRWIEKNIEDFAVSTGIRKENIEILDVGCGTGQMLTTPLGEKGFKITGIDLDETSVFFATEHNKLENIHFLHCDLKNLKHKKFDIIICSEVLEHVENPKDLLYEMAGLMKPESILIITTPNGYGWFEFEKLIHDKLHLRRIARFLRSIYRKIFRPQRTNDTETKQMTLKENDVHLQHFTFRKLQKLFKSCRLEITNKEKSSVFAGPIISFFIRSKTFIRFNSWLADKLPFCCVSAWYFILKKRPL